MTSSYRETMAQTLEFMHIMREYRILERTLTDTEQKRREEIAQDMNDADFKDRYGDRWKEVKMAVATKQAKKESVDKELELDESVIDKVKEIASKKAAAKIDGVTVDSFTASAISQVYDKVNDANKKKMEKLPITKLADLAFKIMQKNEFVPEEVELVTELEDLGRTGQYNIKNGKIHMSKKDYAKKPRDYKGKRSGKPTLMALDPKSGATTSLKLFLKKLNLMKRKKLLNILMVVKKK